jgi:L,D-transpeptidase ErfK/SrfK
VSKALGRPSRCSRRFLTLVSVLLLAGVPAFAQTPDAVAGRLIGGEIVHDVKRGDSLARIGARFGIEPWLLAQSNGLSPLEARLTVGQSMKINNLHIVPLLLEDGLLINIPQRLLFVCQAGAVVAWYPVGLGRPDWPTPVGRFQVRSKEVAPTWHVPVSIQKEMRGLGQAVRTRVPPGPNNPLGHYWIGLSGSACGIHGTNAPTSVYTFRTHGCIRLHPDDVVDLFSRVSVGTTVWIVYEPILLTRRSDGAVFLEVNRDAYQRIGNLRRAADALVAREGVSSVLDATRVDKLVAAKEGLARWVN